MRAKLDALERQIGSLWFRHLFTSITADNGTEFSDIQKLERSVRCSQLRTRLYFAHPYCSSGRGTNENHNGILRRFIPKSTDIGIVRVKSVRHAQDGMRGRPGKILGGLSPLKKPCNAMPPDFVIRDFMEVYL